MKFCKDVRSGNKILVENRGKVLEVKEIEVRHPTDKNPTMVFTLLTGGANKGTTKVVARAFDPCVIFV